MNLEDWTRIYLITNPSSPNTETIMIVSRLDVKQVSGLSYNIEDRDGLIILMVPMNFHNIDWVRLK